MGDSTSARDTPEPQNQTELRWADPRTPFTWRRWSHGADVLRFGGNESPYRPPPELLDAIVAGANRVNRYPFGMETPLVEALSAHLGCSPDQVMIAPGTSPLVETVIKGLGGPDREVVYPDSSYPAYRGAATAVMAQSRAVPLRADGSCDILGLADVCTDRTSLVIVCNPNNPTGGMTPTKDLRLLIDAMPPGALLMIDEAYWEFTDEYADGGLGALEYLDCGRPVLITRTFSKFYGLAGLRVGYGVASEEIAGELHARLRLGGANIVGLVAAEAALGLTKLFADRTELIKAERSRLSEEFGKLGFDPLPTQTNFIFCPNIDDELPAKLMAAGYWVRDGKSVQMPGGMRVTVGTPGENNKLLAAIRAIVETG